MWHVWMKQEHLSHFRAPLLWAILVDCSRSSRPTGAKAAYRMLLPLPMSHLNIRLAGVLNRDRALTDVDVRLCYTLIYPTTDALQHVTEFARLKCTCNWIYVPSGLFLSPLLTTSVLTLAWILLSLYIWPTLMSGCGKWTKGCTYKASACTIL